VGNPPTSGMASIRRRFETAGFSPDVIEIFLSSWSESTKKIYAGPWKAWAEWCTMRGWCPFLAPVNAVLSLHASSYQKSALVLRVSVGEGVKEKCQFPGRSGTYMNGRCSSTNSFED
jgi:hypothetical protein